MPYNGSGNYSAPSNSWNPAVGGTTISSADWNSLLTDLETALSTVITKDGQTTITANLPMSGFKHTGVNTNSGSSSRSEYASGATLQDGGPVHAGTTGGTSTAYTASLTPAITAYAGGQRFTAKTNAACGANPTINFNTVGAKKIYKNIGGTAAQLSAGDVPNNFEMDLIYDTALDSASGGFWILNLPVIVDVSINDFRLTLTTGVPVTTADVTGATTIYCAPYKGNRIALYDGSSWNVVTSAEFSLALGTLSNNTNYDVFCYSNSGTPTLEFTAWTNATTRATALTYQDGVLVKTGALTRRYMGTFLTTSTTTTEDSAAKRFLFNYYNRVARRMRAVQETTSTWTYTTNTYRQANANTANQLNFVIGVSENEITATLVSAASNTSGGTSTIPGIGLDSTSTNSATELGPCQSQVANVYNVFTCFYSGYPSVGYHYLAWLERSSASGTTTWVGDNNLSGLTVACGISGTIFA